jgi:acetyl esterase/lipase
MPVHPAFGVHCRMQNLLHFFLGIMLFTTSCTKNNNTENIAGQTIKNVSYGTDAAQKMDIYLPANRDTTSTKLMVLIHGGGWMNGDKADFAPYITQLQQRIPGYAFANINYRLYTNGQNAFPAQENDVKAAVTFLLNKYAEYKFSKKLVLMGASAGAHLALLQGYKHTGIITPQAIVSFFGPADLTHLYNHPLNPALPLLMAGIVGGTPTQNAAIYQQSSPLTFVTPQSAPTILLQGGADPLVPPAQAEMLKTTLTAAGVTNQLVFYPTEGHGWTGANLEDSFNKIVHFLKTHVQ